MTRRRPLKENRLTFAGTLANGMEYEAQVLVAAEGGTVEADGDTLVFSGCDSLTITLAAGTRLCDGLRQEVEG